MRLSNSNEHRIYANDENQPSDLNAKRVSDPTPPLREKQGSGLRHPGGGGNGSLDAGRRPLDTCDAMLILSRAKITVSRRGEVTVEGLLKRHAAKIRGAIMELGIRGATIRYRFGRYVFSGKIEKNMQQRLRNFLVNECPIPQS